MNKINEHIIKITGKANTEHKLEMDQDVTLKVTGSVVQVIDGSNQDGTVDRTYKIKAVSIEVQ